MSSILSSLHSYICFLFQNVFSTGKRGTSIILSKYMKYESKNLCYHMLHNWHYMMLLYAEYLYCSIKFQFFCYEGHNIAYMHSNRYHLSLMSFECEGLRLNTEIAFLIFFCCKKIVKKFLIYFEKGEAFPSLARSLPEPFLSNDPIPAHSLQPPCISFMNCKCCLLLFHKENYNS